MNDEIQERAAAAGREAAPGGADRSPGYRPPTVTYLGKLAELTQKTSGAADGSTFLGLDIGSV